MSNTPVLASSPKISPESNSARSHRLRLARLQLTKTGTTAELLACVGTSSAKTYVCSTIAHSLEALGPEDTTFAADVPVQWLSGYRSELSSPSQRETRPKTVPTRAQPSAATVKTRPSTEKEKKRTRNGHMAIDESFTYLLHLDQLVVDTLDSLPGHEPLSLHDFLASMVELHPELSGTPKSRIARRALAVFSEQVAGRPYLHENYQVTTTTVVQEDPYSGVMFGMHPEKQL